MRSLAATEHPAMTGDLALVVRAARGDSVAFESLVAPRLDRCYRLAWAILANDADAFDATQEALVAAWRQLPRLREPAAFDAWLHRVVANTARMARRHRTRLREVQVRSIAPDASPSPDQPPTFATVERDPADQVVGADVFARAFERLRAEERAILALHHADDRPVAEIARMLGIPIGTTKWRLHSARRALERALEAEA